MGLPVQEVTQTSNPEIFLKNNKKNDLELIGVSYVFSINTLVF